MFRNRVAYTFVLLGAVVFIYCAGNEVAALLLYSLLLLPAASLIFLLCSLPFFQASQALDRDCVDKGGSAVVQVSLHNRGPLYFPFVMVNFYQNKGAFGAPFRTEPTALPPRALSRREAVSACLYAGRFSVGVSRIWVSDLCGLFLLPIRHAPLTLYVCPQVTKVPVPPELIGLTYRESYNRREQMGEGSEFHSIREYQPGDLIKRVHWGLTAKTGTLQVRQLRRTPDPTCTILLDPRRTAGSESRRIWMNDGLLCCTISLAAAFLEEKIPVKLLFWDGAPRSEALLSAADLRHGQNCLARADFSDTFTLGSLMLTYWQQLMNCRSVMVVTLDDGSELEGQLFELERLWCSVAVCQVALPGQQPGGAGLLLQKSGIGVCRYIAGTGEFRLLSGEGGGDK